MNTFIIILIQFYKGFRRDADVSRDLGKRTSPVNRAHVKSLRSCSAPLGRCPHPPTLFTLFGHCNINVHHPRGVNRFQRFKRCCEIWRKARIIPFWRCQVTVKEIRSEHFLCSNQMPSREDLLQTSLNDSNRRDLSWSLWNLLRFETLCCLRLLSIPWNHGLSSTNCTFKVILYCSRPATSCFKSTTKNWKKRSSFQVL